MMQEIVEHSSMNNEPRALTNERLYIDHGAGTHIVGTLVYLYSMKRIDHAFNPIMIG